MSLWDEACHGFEQQLREKREDPAAIEKFLQDKASLEDARQSATSLQSDSDRKYGLGESRGKGISAKWIRRIMENLDKFLTFGDVSMTAAPESIGLAWFAIRNILGAIQNDYKLYETFNAGLKDITDMMVLVRTYDKIYEGHAVKASGSIYEELSKSILEVYMSILDYFYSVKKHITGGKRSKLVHAFKDTVGALNREFDAKTAAIQTQKVKIVQYSEAAFQQKTTDKLGNVSGELVTIQQTMREVYEFQQQSSSDWKEILSELKASKQPSHREIAVAEYEKNMQRLTPWLDASPKTMSIQMKEREDGTCSWITEIPTYKTWCDSDTSAILCVTGEASFGKSVLGTYVCDELGSETEHGAQVMSQYISVDTRSDNDRSDTSSLIGNTLLRTIYEHALDDTGDDLLLQRCNQLFSNPKQRKSKESSGGSREAGISVRSQNANSDNAPDLSEIYPILIKLLQKRIVLIMDGVDGLSEDDQVQLTKQIINLKSEVGIHVRILVLCRPSSPIRFKLADANIPQISVADHNIGDIKLIVEKGLEKVPGISAAEKNEIEAAILEKTGHQIRYVKQVALSFLRTPLRRPISKWMEDLPENVNETYHQHLHQLTPNYRRLLRIALRWTLTTTNPPLVEEIMEAYSGAYLDGSISDEQNRTDTNLSLYCEQIQKAAGPFLEIRDNRYVTLVDAQAVRSFCKPDQDKPDGDVEGTVCAKCRNAIQISDSFTISGREEHLTMAITCLKHLNSASFQARHLSGYLDEARSRAGKKQTPAESQGEEQSAKTETPGIEQVSDETAANEGPESRSEDRPAEAEMQQPKADDSENQVADEDESIFSDQDKEDIEQILDANDNLELARGRYELIAWFYHVQEAERLWTPDERKASPEWAKLLHEMEQFFLIDTVGFEAWKLAFVPYGAEERGPIFWSAEYGLLSLAELLLDKGAKVTDTTSDGYSALHIASEAPNRLDTLRFFLSHGGDPNFGLPAPISVFHYWLALEADAECVKEMLHHGASCSLMNQWKWNALHYFGLFGKDINVLDLLLDNPFDTENRSNIGVRDGDGETALHKLLSRQEIPLDILKAFLDRGADVNIDDDASERPLYEAAYCGENAAVEMIIARVNDVDDDNKWGRTALHAAAWSGQTKSVEILLKHGADPNRKDKHDRTPLLFSCLTGMYGVIQHSDYHDYQATAELLVEEQIKRNATFTQINAPTKRGRTPLREAAARGFVKVIAAIIGQMKPNDKNWIDRRDDQRGRTALHSAAAHGRAEVTALLLQNGADPSLRDGEKGTGMTSLELCLDRWAVVGSQRYESTIAHLFDANVKEATQNTLLLTTAAIHGSILILEKLANAGVNLNLPDAYGWTPSQLASQYGHPQAESCIRHILARKALRPTQWVSHKEVKSTTTLREDGNHVFHAGENRVSISADHPVPAGLPTYYFEVEFLDAETGELHDTPTDGDSKQPIIAVGFSTSSTAQLIEFPGWPPMTTAPNIRTWAYHGDDGFFGASNQRKWPGAFGQHFGAGDTVGAGLEVDAKQIFFTRNGVRIDDHTFNGFKGRVFPVLGLKDKVQLRTNFGTDPARPFKWIPLQDEQVATEKGLPNGKSLNGS